MAQNNTVLKLPGRGIVSVSGEDRRAFLQGIISNDTDLLDTQPCVYACLLTPQGKFLHDFFMTERDQVIFLECEGGLRAEDLAQRLGRYKLRSKVEIACTPAADIMASFSGRDGFYPDPRHPGMGYRSFPWAKVAPPPEQDETYYHTQRIRLGIPDGSRDMALEKSTLIECNIDKLSGVSYEKGCYVGQELTARMHHRGLAKRHLYPVQSKGHPLPATGTDLNVNGAFAGEMRSSCGDIGLALLKDETAARMETSGTPALLSLPDQA